MSLTPLSFTGISTYSSDFQSIINRAVSIASIPLQSLQNQQKDIVQQKMLVGNLSSAVASLSTALQNLASVSANKSLVASSSDTSKVIAMNNGSASTATYTLSDITSLAKVASESSLSSYADAPSTPVASTPGTVVLTVGGSSKTLDVSANNTLEGLRDAINASGLPVTATILTVSPTENYLSVSANSAGATTLTLTDDPNGLATNLLTSLNQGADTVFKLNGAPVQTPSTQISNIIPGVTLNITGTTGVGGSVDVSLGTNRSAVADALSAVVSAYNTLQDQENAQIGQNAGLLTGDYLVRLVKDDMRQLSGFSGTGGIKSLADLGIEFDTTGHASFDETVFNTLPDSSMNDVFSFLGTESKGFGGLSGLFNQISDPVTGLAKVQMDQYDQTDQRLTDEISTTTDQINSMQESLSAKLSSTDALLGSLESQQKVVDASIQSLQLVLFGKNNQNQ
jgi:flagellar hook-associated protein 2